jgi:VIT1/CCC1 family predicted Fe2+/Mn2+ transporter
MQIHKEPHKSHRIGWLRAAVLGANDGIVSTASIILGVASAGATRENVLIAGVAGLVAGAMSMAAGEYVSVSSQADTEKADLNIEKRSLEENFELERLELAKIYEERGLTRPLASEVASQLMEHDALGAHARDDIGISETVKARPLQAAASSAAAFAAGAALPLATAAIAPRACILPAVALLAIPFLGGLGAIAAHAGGAPLARGAVRVVLWGALAMVLTAGVGKLFGVSV